MTSEMNHAPQDDAAKPKDDRCRQTRSFTEIFAEAAVAILKEEFERQRPKDARGKQDGGAA
jgi:hypothetical protein